MIKQIEEDSFAVIKKLQAEGLSGLSVAKRSGWSYVTVHRVFHSEDMDGYRALNKIRYKANHEKDKARIQIKRLKEAPPERVIDEDEIQVLYDSGYTTQQVCTELKLNKFAIERINVTRRRDGRPSLWQKNVCRQEVDRHEFISNGIRKIAYLLDMVDREHQSLVTVQSDSCVEWTAGTSAIQKSLMSFRRRVNTSKKGAAK